MRLYLESASSAEGAAGIRNAIICDYIFSTLHLPQVPISLLLPTRPRPSPRQSGHLSAPPAPSSVPASLPLLLPPPPHSPVPRRRPDGAVTTVVTPRPTPLPPCLAFRAPEEGRPLGAATMDLWLGGLREEPGARAPPGIPMVSKLQTSLFLLFMKSVYRPVQLTLNCDSGQEVLLGLDSQILS